MAFEIRTTLSPRDDVQYACLLGSEDLHQGGTARFGRKITPEFEAVGDGGPCSRGGLYWLSYRYPAEKGERDTFKGCEKWEVDRSGSTSRSSWGANWRDMAGRWGMGLLRSVRGATMGFPQRNYIR
jgi:hypothetical protein